MIHKKLQVCLTEVCTNFNANKYEKALTGYRLLSKTDRVVLFPVLKMLNLLVITEVLFSTVDL